MAVNGLIELQVKIARYNNNKVALPEGKGQNLKKFQDPRFTNVAIYTR